MLEMTGVNETFSYAKSMKSSMCFYTSDTH